MRALGSTPRSLLGGRLGRESNLSHHVVVGVPSVGLPGHTSWRGSVRAHPLALALPGAPAVGTIPSRCAATARHRGQVVARPTSRPLPSLPPGSPGHPHHRRCPRALPTRAAWRMQDTGGATGDGQRGGKRRDSHGGGDPPMVDTSKRPRLGVAGEVAAGPSPSAGHPHPPPQARAAAPEGPQLSCKLLLPALLHQGRFGEGALPPCLRGSLRGHLAPALWEGWMGDSSSTPPSGVAHVHVAVSKFASVLLPARVLPVHVKTSEHVVLS